MGIRQIVGVIALILMLPTLFSLIVFSLHINNENSQEDIEEAGQLLADSVTPWWIGLVETLSGWGTFGAIVIIAFFLILKKYPELS